VIPLKVLTIGHSYVVRLNRSVMAKVAESNEIDLTLVGPEYFHGDLRRLSLEREQAPPYQLQTLPAHLTSKIHLFFYTGLKQCFSQKRFDLIHAWEEPYIVAGFQIARAAKKLKTKYIFRTAQSLVKKYPRPFNWFESFCVDSANGWIAGGGLVKKAMIRKGFPADSGETITLGVDENYFKPNPEAGAQIRKKLELTGPVVGFVGRLSEAKGLDILMPALEQLNTKWSLLVLGSGPYKEKILNWAQAKNFEDRVRVVLVNHDEVPGYLNAMDILVAPSQTMPNWKEQFGRMIIEAFACKVPVIGSDSGEIPFVISDAGLIVAEKDIQSWTNAIGNLLESEKNRIEWAERGYEHCLATYSSSKVARKYIDYYKRIVAS